MFMNRQRSRRVVRQFSPTLMGTLGDQILEPRKLTAPFFYRSGTFNLGSQVIDLGVWPAPPGNDIQVGTPDPTAHLTSQGHATIFGWSATSSVLSNAVVDSGSATQSATSTVSISVSHADQGEIHPENNPDNLYAIPRFVSRAQSTGTVPIAPISWVLANPNQNGTGPGNGALPAGEQIMTTFQANYTGSNTENFAIPSLAITSNTMNVAINRFGGGLNVPGLVITAPGKTGGLTLPAGVVAPPGAVLYYDADFGTAGGTDSATQVDLTNISSAGPYTMSLLYNSTLASPGLGLPQQNNPNGPDQTFYQDGFDWTISYQAVAQS